MAEAIGIAAGLVGLATFASESSVKLYQTIISYQSHQQRVRDLAEETAALSDVLSSLAETARATTELNLSALNIPLQRCGKACQEFEEEIQKFSLRSTGNRASFRDWARLRYMGEDIDGFRRLLSGYKMTISIALTDANLRKSAITAENIEGYHELLNTARADLEDRLEIIDDKLDLMLSQGVAGSESDASEMKQIKQERLSTEKCLQICAQLSEHINQLQISASSGEDIDSSSVPERITHEGLQECKGSLARMASKLSGHEKQLFNRLADKMNAGGASTQEAADVARLRDEWESTRESMNVLSMADNYLEKNISVIENHATGDAVQVMVSANGKALHGTNRGMGWRTRQIGGYLSNETVQQISRDMARVSTRYADNDGLSPGREAPNTDDNGAEMGRHSVFEDRYGDGFKLTSKSTSNMSASFPSTTDSKTNSKTNSSTKSRQR